MAETVAPRLPAQSSLPSRVRQFYALTKPRVVQLIVFCAVIGMLLATPGLPPWRLALAATAGIWLVAAAAAAFNCMVERGLDAKMARTAWRPTARGQLTTTQTLSFSAVLCAAGSALLYFEVNALTMWLTFATFVGYAVISKVPNTLHTPLMSGTNAIHGIVVLGGLVLLAEGSDLGVGTQVILFIALLFGAINVVGGFVVTDRMLEMFKAKPKELVEADGEEKP